MSLELNLAISSILMRKNRGIRSKRKVLAQFFVNNIFSQANNLTVSANQGANKSCTFFQMICKWNLSHFVLFQVL